MSEPHGLTVLWCGDDSPPIGAFARILDACPDGEVHPVGPRPGKPIDPLLTGRVLVIGEDADLAAVALRLLRRDLLTTVDLAYAAAEPTPITRLHGLPVGPAAVRLALDGPPDEVTLVRDDVGGVLLGLGEIGPITGGTVYVDEHNVLRGPAERIQVRPDPARGLAVTVTRRRVAGLFGPRPTITTGRAVQMGMAPTTVRLDGREYPRPMDRWTFYKHTAPLRLVRPPR
ncbi:MAG TPA: hypothetical protein VIC62_00255 [Nakamurella sp.]